MEVGKLYKGDSGLIVLCTETHGDLGFSGTVVVGDNTYDAGYKNSVANNGHAWNDKTFKLFDIDNTTVLKEGVTYNIPEGCKVAIKDGKVSIENNTKYCKCELTKSVIYSKHVLSENVAVVELYNNGGVKLSSLKEEDSVDISDCCKEIDEVEFTNAYNTALKNLEL